MQCLLIMCHPRKNSLNAALADTAATALRAAGHELSIRNLYQQDFQPVLSVSDLQAIQAGLVSTVVATEAAELQAAECLVLVFPTWWFGMPAMLKGWFDRVWGPGVAYELVQETGALLPRLHGLKRTIAITTQGSPWWVDRLVMRQPARKVLKRAILGLCAPQSRLEFLSFYKCEKPSPKQVEVMKRRVISAMRCI